MLKEKPKILVVGDDQTNVVLLETVLKSEGYVTLSAPDGENAVEAAKREQPDLIFSDIMMPEVDGLSMCRELRKTSECPVIF